VIGRAQQRAAEASGVVHGDQGGYGQIVASVIEKQMPACPRQNGEGREEPEQRSPERNELARLCPQKISGLVDAVQESPYHCRQQGEGDAFSDEFSHAHTVWLAAPQGKGSGKIFSFFSSTKSAF
jgi:hypothetical protein